MENQTGKTMEHHYSFAVVGDWHLAFVTAACLTQLGHKVLLVNPCLTEESAKWAEFPVLALKEPGLLELIQEARTNKQLDFANGISDDWTADVIWLAIDTPVNERDEADITPLVQVAKQVSNKKRQTSEPPIFTISSQIPLGFCHRIEKEFGLEVAYIPENLRLGKGVETFLQADRTVIGANSSRLRELLQHHLKNLRTEFFLCDLVTSEMIKHATNAFLASSISFANELARIGEVMGVDNQKVAQALKLDKRIGKGAYVAPGLGFAGGTLPRDLRILQDLGRKFKIPTRFVDAVLEVNSSTAEALAHSVIGYLQDTQEPETIRSKTVLVLGYSYKAEIDTLRRSPAIELGQVLLSEGIRVLGYDPFMNHCDLTPLAAVIRHFSQWSEIEFCPDAVVVMTARSEFMQLDWAQLYRKPRRIAQAKQPLVLDTTGQLNSSAVGSAGFAFKQLWQPIERQRKAHDSAPLT